MSYVEKHLIEGETIIYETRLHWIILIKPVLLGLFVGFLGLALLLRSPSGIHDLRMTSNSSIVPGAMLLVLALILIARGLLIRNATEMTVTNKRVFVTTGVKVPDAEMDSLALTPAHFHGDWNYTIHPRE